MGYGKRIGQKIRSFAKKGIKAVTMRGGANRVAKGVKKVSKIGRGGAQVKVAPNNFSAIKRPPSDPLKGLTVKPDGMVDVPLGGGWVKPTPSKDIIAQHAKESRIRGYKAEDLIQRELDEEIIRRGVNPLNIGRNETFMDEYVRKSAEDAIRNPNATWNRGIAGRQAKARGGADKGGMNWFQRMKLKMKLGPLKNMDESIPGVTPEINRRRALKWGSLADEITGQKVDLESIRDNPGNYIRSIQKKAKYYREHAPLGDDVQAYFKKDINGVQKLVENLQDANVPHNKIIDYRNRLFRYHRNR